MQTTSSLSSIKSCLENPVNPTLFRSP